MPLPVIAGIAAWKLIAGAVAAAALIWAVVQVTKVVISLANKVAQIIADNLPLLLGAGLLWFILVSD